MHGGQPHVSLMSWREAKVQAAEGPLSGHNYKGILWRYAGFLSHIDPPFIVLALSPHSVLRDGDTWSAPWPRKESQTNCGDLVPNLTLISCEPQSIASHPHRYISGTQTPHEAGFGSTKQAMGRRSV